MNLHSEDARGEVEGSEGGRLPDMYESSEQTYSTCNSYIGREHFQAGKIILVTHDDLPTCTNIRPAGCRRGGLTSVLSDMAF